MWQGEPVPSLRIIGPGRAGGSLASALALRGWTIEPPLGRADDLREAAAGVDVLVVATPDASIAEVAGSVEPAEATIVHLAGSLGLEVLAPHERRAAVHPLTSLPNASIGADRLLAGGWFAVAGDPVAEQIVTALGGRSVVVADADRSIYHAAACVAANHVVALLGQVERLAVLAGVPLDAYLELTAGAVDSVRTLGARDALTGPAARGDVATIERHRAALPAAELELYDVLARAAHDLATGASTSEGSGATG